MNDPTSLAARFREEHLRLLQDRIGTTAVVAAFVFPFFVLEDLELVPDRWQDVYALRLSCSLVCLLAWAGTHSRFARNHTFAWVALVMAALSVVKSFVTAMDVSGIRSLYFGGHALILVGCLAYLPLTGPQALVLGAICVLGYAAPTLLFASPLDPVAFQIQVGLLTAIGLQLAVGCHLHTGVRFREFQLRTRLYLARRRAEDYGFQAAE